MEPQRTKPPPGHVPSNVVISDAAAHGKKARSEGGGLADVQDASSITPERGAFDLTSFALSMTEPPLYSFIISWLMEKSNRSMAIALACHAAGHIDHIERDQSATLTLYLCHLSVLAVAALIAARSLGPMDATMRPGHTG